MPVLPSSALCYYNFESDLNDTLGLASVSNTSVALSTTQKKFGTNSAYFAYNPSNPTVGSYLKMTLPSSNVGTVAMWIYRTGSNTSAWYPTAFCVNASTSTTRGAYIHLDDGSFSTYPQWRVTSTTGSGDASQSGTTLFTANTWHHVALTRSGTTFKYYLDGVLQATLSQPNPPTMSILYLGNFFMSDSPTSGCYFQGYIDEVLVTSEVLWSTDFTPPAEAYTMNFSRNYTSATGGTVQDFESNGVRYRCHTFTQSGNFNVSTVGDSSINLDKIECLVVAGGGTGTNSPWGGAGGGAGGVIYNSSLAVTTGNTTVTVGGSAEDSYFGLMRAFAGGSSSAGSGGSGSGGGHTGSSGQYGASIQTSNNGGIGYGNAGGTNTYANPYPCGSGGGAGASGSNGGAGGAGRAFNITGSAVYYAGGGGQVNISDAGTAGGIGGGGAGVANGNGVNGTANTGGGGGGSRGGSPGIGGSGIVIARYVIPKIYAINTNAGVHGSISPSGTAYVSAGGNQQFDITSDTGYEIDTLTVDGSNVTPSTSYSFNNVTSAHTIAVTFKLIGPSAPTYVSQNISQVTMNVASFQSATQYRIYRDSSLIATVSASGNYTDTLSATGTYQYTVSAYNNSAWTAQSPALSVQLTSKTMTDLSLTEKSDRTVSLSWSSFSNAASYKLYNGTNVVYTGSNTSFTDQNLTAETNYSYQISAVANSIETNKSSVFTVKTGLSLTKYNFSILKTSLLSKAVTATDPNSTVTGFNFKGLVDLVDALCDEREASGNVCTGHTNLRPTAANQYNFGQFVGISDSLKALTCTCQSEACTCNSRNASCSCNSVCTSRTYACSCVSVCSSQSWSCSCQYNSNCSCNTQCTCNTQGGGSCSCNSNCSCNSDSECPSQSGCSGNTCSSNGCGSDGDWYCNCDSYGYCSCDSQSGSSCTCETNSNCSCDTYCTCNTVCSSNTTTCSCNTVCSNNTLTCTSQVTACTALGYTCPCKQYFS